MKRIKFIFKWYDLWIGIFIDTKKGYLYILPIPCCGVIIKFNLFKEWMSNLEQVAFKWNAVQYPLGGKWAVDFWKKSYFDKGATPEQAWKDYTTMVY